MTDLRDYAAIGDGRTVALISSSGSVDWLPLPNLDSVPVFASLLDAEMGGVIELGPIGEHTVRRRYADRTNVLVATYTTASGTARVTDAMVTGVAGRLPWAELARRIEGIDGEVEFAWRVRPGTRLQTASPWLEDVEGTTLIRIGDISLGVVGFEHGATDPRTRAGDGLEVSGSFTTSPGSRHLLVVVGTEGEPLHLPDPRNVDRGIDRTIAAWREWSTEFSYDGPWAKEVQRSALALKLLIHSPTGAIAAAATTSLPESAGGGKNWDYRLAWVRDLAYTAHALVRFGLREETQAAISWLLRTIRRHGPDLAVMYTLHGETDIRVREFDVPGWRGIGPVVAGNPADGQLQLGVYGDLFAICREYVEAGNILDIPTGRMLAGVADRTCDLWRSRDSGMWELPDREHYTSSKMGCWQALNDAVVLAERGQIPGNPDRWRSERDRIAEWIAEHGWSDDLGAYVMHPGSTRLDTSVLLHAVSGFDSGERMSSTIDVLYERLGVGAHLYRYTGMPAEEHAFVACGFWRAQALAAVGRVDEAVVAMDALVATASDTGIFAEMISPDDGSFWGNLPQALSHLGLISAALTIRDTPQGP